MRKNIKRGAVISALVVVVFFLVYLVLLATAVLEVPEDTIGLLAVLFAGAIFLAPLFFGLGAFIGALVGAWLGCLVMELLRGRPGKEAFDAAFGTMMGRFLGTVCKLGTGSAMVVLTAHRIWPDMAPVPPPLRPVVPEPGQVVMLLKNWLC